MTPSSRPRLISIPADDVVLRKYAERVASGGSSDAAGLERLLRPLFPDAVVRPRHSLASDIVDDDVWYVYRDRLYRRWTIEDETLAPESAVGVLDDYGTFVDVQDSAAGLFGASRAELIGRDGRTFCAPGFESWYDDVLDTLGHVGVIATGWQIYREDRTTNYVDLTIVKDGAGIRRHKAAFHVVPVDHARGWFGAPAHHEDLAVNTNPVLREARPRRAEPVGVA